MIRTRLSDGELAALAARIQRDYDYDDHSGKLVNRKTGRTVKGKQITGRQYMMFRIIFQGRWMEVLMHRAVWAWHHGRFPTLQIDHINGNGFDNRIGNLREVTQSENQRNQYRQWKPNARTGLPGVCKHGNGYQIKVGHHHYHFHDKNVAFYHLTLLGRRFR